MEYFLDNIGTATESTLNAKAKSTLKELYNEAYSQYITIINETIKINDSITEEIITNYINKIKLWAGNVEHKKGAVNWTRNIKQKVPKLVGMIFGLWTLLNCNYYYENEDHEE